MSISLSVHWLFKYLNITFIKPPFAPRDMNSWDPVWEDIYASREWGKYPPEELIRFIARTFYAVPDRKAIRILDLGCGSGAATWYVAREGFSAFGIDGSPSAIRTISSVKPMSTCPVRIFCCTSDG